MCKPLLLILLGALAGCNRSNHTPPASVRPVANNLSARANANNALSALVVFDAKNITSARVFASGGGEDTVTPATPIVDGRQEVLVLGLLAATNYVFTLELTGSAETLTMPTIAFTTPALPAFIENQLLVTTVGTSSGGYTLTNILTSDPSQHYLFAFDDRGRVRWYRHLPGLGASSEKLANGNYLTFMGISTGFQADYGYFLELTPSGAEVARYEAPRPYYTDGHELLFTPAVGGGQQTHFFSYDIRVIDTTSIGGQPNTNIAGHQILRYRADGNLEFRWNAWDHFVIEDWIEEPSIDRTRPDGDFDHPNSLEIDRDGNYIVSWRNMAEITKINSTTGEIMWRFGGRNNEFAILDDPLFNPAGRGFAFCGQHSARVLPNGNILLFDNGLRHNPQQSRAVEYRLDVAARTATMVWESRHAPVVYAPFTGNVARLANGNTIVGYAFRGLVVEVDAAANEVWKAAVTINNLSALTYRMNRIDSLYR